MDGSSPDGVGREENRVTSTTCFCCWRSRTSFHSLELLSPSSMASARESAAIVQRSAVERTQTVP